MDSVTLQLLEQARHYINLDKSKFIRQSIREKAETVIAAHEKTHFGPEDWAHFFDILDKSMPKMKKRLVFTKNSVSSRFQPAKIV